MEHINIPEEVYKTLFESLGVADEVVETKDKKGKTKKIVESKVEESEDETEEVVNEDEDAHFCPVCEGELPEDFDDDVLMERLSAIYEQLEVLNEAMSEDDESDEDESEDEDSEDEVEEDEDEE